MKTQPFSIDLMQIFGILLFTAIIILLYLLPTILSMKRKHVGGIALLNIFFGWTFFGWFAALIWAVSSPIDKQIYSYHITYSCTKCGYRKAFEQKLKLYKCPQCGQEHPI